MKATVLLFLLLNTSFLFSQDNAEKIDSYLNTYASTGDFSGCVRIVKGENVLYESCVGKSDDEKNEANGPRTAFRIGSISKQFTATAILLLEEEGLLSTSDRLARFFPAYPKVADISLEQLLTHRSGIPDIFALDNFQELVRSDAKLEALSKSLLEAGPEFEPGSRYQYSNGAYALLAQIIEDLSGMSYQTFIQQKIFAPLGMKHSGQDVKQNQALGMAKGYEPKGYQQRVESVELPMELLKGSGSLYSDVNDLNIWINSLKEKSLLSEASYQKFFKNYGNNYGFGISLYKVFDRQVFGHDGRINGFIADYLHYEEADISIIILGNIQTGVADFIRRDLGAIVFEESYESRAKTVSASADQHLAFEDAIGVYAFGPNFRVYVDEIDGQLHARANEGAYTELVPVEGEKYFSRTLYAFIKFEANEKGAVDKLLWINNDGNSFAGEKE
ncbi:MAG: serine hydrolase domain-containing protein [Bacteroidota bacterium]